MVSKETGLVTRKKFTQPHWFDKIARNPNFDFVDHCLLREGSQMNTVEALHSTCSAYMFCSTSPIGAYICNCTVTKDDNSMQTCHVAFTPLTRFLRRPSQVLYPKTILISWIWTRKSGCISWPKDWRRLFIHFNLSRLAKKEQETIDDEKK